MDRSEQTQQETAQELLRWAKLKCAEFEAAYTEAVAEFTEWLKETLLLEKKFTDGKRKHEEARALCLRIIEARNSLNPAIQSFQPARDCTATMVHSEPTQEMILEAERRLVESRAEMYVLVAEMLECTRKIKLIGKKISDVERKSEELLALCIEAWKSVHPDAPYLPTPDEP